MINTPEWHHWHHAIDADARDKNFGLPVVDKIFGTAYLPKDRRPTGFGIHDPVPQDGYLRHLAYPFTEAARPPGGPRGRGVGGVRFGMISGWPKSAVGTSGGRIRSSSSPTSPSSRSTWVT